MRAHSSKRLCAATPPHRHTATTNHHSTSVRMCVCLSTCAIDCRDQWSPLVHLLQRLCGRLSVFFLSSETFYIYLSSFICRDMDPTLCFVEACGCRSAGGMLGSVRSVGVLCVARLSVGHAFICGRSSLWSKHVRGCVAWPFVWLTFCECAYVSMFGALLNALLFSFHFFFIYL